MRRRSARTPEVRLAVAIGLLGLSQGLVRADVGPGRGDMDLAFVLLSKPGLPSGEDVVRAFAPFAVDGQRLRLGPSGPKAAGNEMLELDGGQCGTVFVAAVPVPVPDREADEAVQFSISAMGTGWKLAPHAAHLLVTAAGTDSSSRVTTLSCFTSILAAVTKASRGIGVYWGNAQATHDPAFFVSVAQERGLQPRLMLWTGVSVAREADGRLSLLSLGMQQLNLPDLLLVAPKSMSGTDALATLFDLLGYLVDRGKPLPDGDTVGRSAEERLPVRYVPSPVDATKQVWRVEIK